MRRALLAAAALTLGLVACKGPESGEAPEAPGGDEALSRTAEEGPVKAVVTLTPQEPTLGDPLVLSLEVEAEAGVTVELPDFGEALGRFSIVDFTPRAETRPDGSSFASQRYTLQPPMSGRQRIPRLRVEFVDERPGQVPDGELAPVRELLTEELTVHVASVLPEASLSDELRPVRGSLSERPRGFAARVGLGVGAALLLAGCALLYRSWRLRALERARSSAFDVAMGRIETLEGRGLPGAEEADGWYVELSAIVRRYLEDRFGVRAPELTTEEFLREARRSAELTNQHRELLSSFLEQCDRVKFAAYLPEEAESSRALETARRFLTETRLRREPAARRQAA